MLIRSYWKSGKMEEIAVRKARPLTFREKLVQLKIIPENPISSTKKKVLLSGAAIFWCDL